MEIFRGDTFKFDFSATLEGSTELHTFEVGDVLKAGIKEKIKNTDYLLYQEKTITAEAQEIPFEFSHEETMELPISSTGESLPAILEVELTNTAGVVSTLYQEEIEIAGDVINE